MPFIKWVEETEATGEVAELYQLWRAANPHRDKVPEILKCFSWRADFLRSVLDFSYRLHFSEGHLSRRIKEMIATYVSGLNRCPY
ncbi:MAG: hypothetical protein KatS3mg110_0831 [Pirellulaceae bacterium]|nr:MAG: hypothetical protein KatS3mg110_0831 [Pirellulaceae bacterium]